MQTFQCITDVSLFLTQVLSVDKNPKQFFTPEPRHWYAICNGCILLARLPWVLKVFYGVTALLHMEAEL